MPLALNSQLFVYVVRNRDHCHTKKTFVIILSIDELYNSSILSRFHSPQPPHQPWHLKQNWKSVLWPSFKLCTESEWMISLFTRIHTNLFPTHGLRNPSSKHVHIILIWQIIYLLERFVFQSLRVYVTHRIYSSLALFSTSTWCSR